MTDNDDVIVGEHLSKSFGRVTALEDVNMHLKRGEVLALLGDNGAGKSTLMKMITGFHQPSGGQLYIDGQPVEIKSVMHARELGIEPVYQDLALVSDLSVYRNMFLRRELTKAGPLRVLDDRRMRRIAREHLDQMGVRLPSVNVPISKLSGGQRQAVAVARSVYSDAKVLLLDEPTASLDAANRDVVVAMIGEAKVRGAAVVGIFHDADVRARVVDRTFEVARYGAAA